MASSSQKTLFSKSLLSLVLLFCYIIIVSNCTKNDAAEPDPKPDESTLKSSFDLIQEQIFTTSCATPGCHESDKDNSFKQHGLILAKGKAYKNLINITPKNLNAITDKLKLVTAFKSAESLLFHKLNWNTEHHAKSYGSPMPLGGKSLYAGQIEFVRRWIEAGAPEKGKVVDEKLLEDKTEAIVDDANFAALDAPKSTEGFQLKVEKFEIAPNFEREIFVRRDIGNASEVFVNRYKLKSRQNSHHMVIYSFKEKAILPPLNQIRDLRNPNNTLNLITAISTADHIFLGGGSDSQGEYYFPEGTALLLPTNATVDLNPHYFNKTNSIRYGENYVNFYTVEKEKVKNVVKMLNLANQSISIKPNERKTISKSWTFPTANNIVMLTSHTHKLGEKFLIKIKGGARDGEVVYETTDWEHPLVKNFEKPLQLLKGEGLTSEVTYFNNTNKTVKFGLTSEDEMNIIFGYYYEVK
jgi:Copper type II ascorbate-dependent monooxygenase, C-terminal domain